MAREAKRALTPEAFGKFLRWLAADDDLAAREYESIRRKLIRYFIHKGCADPDDLFDRAVDIVVGKIETCGDCSNPLAYCYGVAKNVWRWHMRNLPPVALVEDVASPKDPDGEAREHEAKCLERCMAQLSSGDRDAVTRYYEGEGHDKIVTRKVLADQVGGPNALRIKVCRIRKDLRVCVVECVKRSVN